MAGRDATDIKGRQLKIISNLLVIPGAVVYTDGAVIYGYDIPATQEYIRRGKPEVFPADMVFFGVGDVWGGYDFTVDGSIVSPFNVFRPNIPALNIEAPSDVWWSGHPPFFNVEDKAFSIRGNWRNPTVYGTGLQQWKLSDKSLTGALLLGASGNNLFWQKGNMCQTADTILTKLFSYPKRTEEYSPVDHDLETITYTWEADGEPSRPALYDITSVHDQSGNDYDTSQLSSPTLSLDGQNHNDLQVVMSDLSGNTVNTFPLRQTVESILSSIVSEVSVMQNETVQGFPSTLFPPNVPAPVLCAYGLGFIPEEYGFGNPFGVGEDWDGNKMPCPKLWLSVPADTASGFGGNPEEYIDWWYVDDFVDVIGAHSIFDLSDFQNDWRLVRHLEYENGVLSFDLIVKAKLICNMPTYYVRSEEVPDPDPTNPNVHGVTVVPAMGGDVTMREPTEIVYQGYYNVKNGQTTQLAKYIARNTIDKWRLPEEPDYTIEATASIKDIYEPRKQFVFTWGKYAWDVQTKALKWNGQTTGDTYDFVRKVIEVSNEQGDFGIVLAVQNALTSAEEPQNNIYIYNKDRRIHSLVPWYDEEEEIAVQHVINDVFCTIDDVTKYTALDSSLPNTPYYDTDT